MPFRRRPLAHSETALHCLVSCGDKDLFIFIEEVA